MLHAVCLSLSHEQNCYQLENKAERESWMHRHSKRCHIWNMSKNAMRRKAASLHCCLHFAAAAVAMSPVNAVWTAVAAPPSSFYWFILDYNLKGCTILPKSFRGCTFLYELN
ncbi:hypothetical protein AB3S75_001185 [Citrus x aurantiifolia]